MKKVKVEFNYPDNEGQEMTFSLAIEGMSVTSAKELVRLPEMIERQYKEYLGVVSGLPNQHHQTQSDTQ